LGAIARLDEVLAELERAKPGRDRGWIVRDRNIVWIVNGLACEPALTAANSQKHVPFVQSPAIAVWVEHKSFGGRQRPGQNYFKKLVEACGVRRRRPGRTPCMAEETL